MTDRTKVDGDPETLQPDGGTPGGSLPEQVEDRPDGSQVTPEDYPEDQRAR